MPFKRLTNGEPSVGFTVYETLVLPKQSGRQVEATRQAHANLFPFEVITEATQPTFPVDDRCAHCKEFDKDGCYNCGPLTIAKVFNPAEPPIPIDDLRKAFEALDHFPLKVGGHNPPNTASFVDDNPENPVQICDSQGNQLMLMTLGDYEALLAWKTKPLTPEVTQKSPEASTISVNSFLPGRTPPLPIGIKDLCLGTKDPKDG